MRTTTNADPALPYSGATQAPGAASGSASSIPCETPGLVTFRPMNLAGPAPKSRSSISPLTTTDPFAGPAFSHASFHLAPRYVFRAYPGGVAERLAFCGRCASAQHLGDVDARGGEVIAVCAFTRDRNRFGEEDLSRVECESCLAQIAEELRLCRDCGEAYPADEDLCPLCGGYAAPTAADDHEGRRIS